MATEESNTATKEAKVKDESKLADEASTQEPEEKNPAEESKVDQEEDLLNMDGKGKVMLKVLITLCDVTHLTCK